MPDTPRDRRPPGAPWIPQLGLVERGGRCPAQAEHAPVWGRADVAELTDHPRGLRFPAETAHGVTVWVTRCQACETPLLIVGAWGTGRADPPTIRPPLILELTGAEMSAEARAVLDEGQDEPLRPPMRFPPPNFGQTGPVWRGN